jgi:hypothetical protein
LYQVVKPGSAGGLVTGRKGPKAGNRLRRALPGEGQIMDSDPDSSTFRKRAHSKNAREMRAEAAERRLQALAGEQSEEDELASEEDDEGLEELEELAADMDAWDDLNASDGADASDTDDEDGFGLSKQVCPRRLA